MGKPEWDGEAFSTTRPGEVECDKRRQETTREPEEASNRAVCSLELNGVANPLTFAMMGGAT